MKKIEYPQSKTPKFQFSQMKETQLKELQQGLVMKRMEKARKEKEDDPYRPLYHYVNSEYKLNDPNGLCFWQGTWHLFYQAYPPEDARPHWGHAISEDLINWKELPYAIYPGPENACYSGTTWVEDDRVIAMYHGTGIGNMVAVSKDPLLLNWDKLTNHAVIPFPDEGEKGFEYGIFDPCIWKRDDYYYSLSAGIEKYRPEGKHLATNSLFRSADLVNWEYLHPFIEGDRFTLLGDDGACPYFFPIGNRHMLIFFSHMSGGQYLLGDYDIKRDKFIVDAHGKFNFGATFPSGVHAPTVAVDAEDLIVIFNMNPGKPTHQLNSYFKDYFQGTIVAPEPGIEDWDQIMTLPRRLSLEGKYDINMKPAGNIESLRMSHVRIDHITLTRNKKEFLEGIGGNAIEMQIVYEPVLASHFEIDVLCSPDNEEYTRISFFNNRGFKYRTPIDDVKANKVISTQLSALTRYESIISIDTSHASILPDVISRPPETAPVLIKEDELVDLRIFIDRSVVEVFVNNRQCVSVRVYPSRADSTLVSVLSQGQDSEVVSLDCWQMKNIYA